MARLRLHGGDEGATPDDVVQGEKGGPDWGGLVGEQADGQEGMDVLENFSPDVKLRESVPRSGGEEFPGKGPDDWGGQARFGETARERTQVTPRMPSVPTPKAGSQQELPNSSGSSGGSSYRAPMGGVIPFTPMGSPVISGQSRGGSALYGSLGGLQGGGLGQPLDPTPNEQSDPISTLLQLLMSRR